MHVNVIIAIAALALAAIAVAFTARLLVHARNAARSSERIRILTEERHRHDAITVAEGPADVGAFTWRCGSCNRRSTLRGVTREDTVQLATQHLEFCPGQFARFMGQPLTPRGRWDHEGRRFLVAWTSDREWGVNLHAAASHTV